MTSIVTKVTKYFPKHNTVVCEFLFFYELIILLYNTPQMMLSNLWVESESILSAIN